jgi:uncharacterized protein YecE (DUF72 family)
VPEFVGVEHRADRLDLPVEDVERQGVTIVEHAKGAVRTSLLPSDLMKWADRIRELSLAGRDVFVYFNNDCNANTARNARALQVLLGSDGVSYPATSLINSGQV